MTLQKCDVIDFGSVTWICVQEVMGSSLSQVSLRSNLGQVIYTYVRMYVWENLYRAALTA